MAKLDETTNATSLVDSATFTDGSLAPESSKSTVAKVFLPEKSHPLEFRGGDQVSPCWVIGRIPRPCSLISRKHYVVTLR